MQEEKIKFLFQLHFAFSWQIQLQLPPLPLPVALCCSVATPYTPPKTAFLCFVSIRYRLAKKFMQEFLRICAKVCATAKKNKRKQKQKLELKQQPKILVYLFLENKRNGDCKHTGMAKKGNKMPGTEMKLQLLAHTDDAKSRSVDAQLGVGAGGKSQVCTAFACPELLPLPPLARLATPFPSRSHIAPWRMQ